jgi:hypothetical protein
VNSVVRRSRQYRISGERKDELIGDAETVARKVLFGGLSRSTFQSTVTTSDLASVSHEFWKMEIQRG